MHFTKQKRLSVSSSGPECISVGAHGARPIGRPPVAPTRTGDKNKRGPFGSPLSFPLKWSVFSQVNNSVEG
jgi:hypothetical protein